MSLSLCLNSLYHMIFGGESFLKTGHQFIKSIRAVINIHRNMKRAKVRMHEMEGRIVIVDQYINYSRPLLANRLDKTR